MDGNDIASKNSIGLSLGAKVALPAIVSLVFLLISTALALYAMGRLQSVVADLHDVKFKHLCVAQDIHRKAQDVNSHVYKVISWTAAEYDAAKIEELKRRQAGLLGEIESDLMFLTDETSLQAAEKSHWRPFEWLWMITAK